MVDLRNYDFISITYNKVKLEKYFINSYVNECLESRSSIISTRRMHIILYAKYKNNHLNTVMPELCQHLNGVERYRLLNLLRKIEDLFGGTFGTWNTTLVEFQLNDNSRPVCSQPYPIPRVHGLIKKKEVERLVRLGVIEEANESEWGAPSFAQPKAKTNRVIFLSDFQNLNRQLKSNP